MGQVEVPPKNSARSAQPIRSQQTNKKLSLIQFNCTVIAYPGLFTKDETIKTI